MKHVYASDERARIAFAEEAARHFAANPAHWSYSNCKPNAIQPGELLAMRWGMGDDCVLVLRVGDDEPVIYGQLVRQIEPVTYEQVGSGEGGAS
jgi:hypothetical protein